MPGIQTAFGGAMIGPERAFKDEKAVEEVMKVLESEGVKIIDTAQLYEGSEALLGKVSAWKRFIIDTKATGGFKPGSTKKDALVSAAKESMERLGAKKLDIFYIHAPDPDVPLSETLAGINEIYKAGHFARFGLSNFKVEQVTEVYEHCKKQSYVLPTVYQGNYSAVARKQETLLFPTLRKLGIAFYAYSPLAGGFLTKTKQQIQDGAGRFDTSTPIGKMYSGMYSKPAYLDALADWESIAKEAGCSRADMAYRWVKFNSDLNPEHGDAIIVGASSLDQLKQTLKGMDAGPLRDNITSQIDRLWKKIEAEAPLDNYWM